MLCPKPSGTPRMLTRCPRPGRSEWLDGFCDDTSLTDLPGLQSRLPLKRHFGQRRVRIGAVIDRLDHEPDPPGFDCADVHFLTRHAVSERQLTRAAVGELCGHGGETIVPGPNLRALEITALNQNSMNHNLAIEIETNPLGYAAAINPFDPRPTALPVDALTPRLRGALHPKTP